MAMRWARLLGRLLGNVLDVKLHWSSGKCLRSGHVCWMWHCIVPCHLLQVACCLWPGRVPSWTCAFLALGRSGPVPFCPCAFVAPCSYGSVSFWRHALLALCHCDMRTGRRTANLQWKDGKLFTIGDLQTTRYFRLAAGWRLSANALSIAKLLFCFLGLA